ncbi:MAG: hypothetical protein JWP75_4137 [Frondihabitans sp.]|nr:hypothetical protein [Frondihabitans sp.]
MGAFRRARKATAARAARRSTGVSLRPCLTGFGRVAAAVYGQARRARPSEPRSAVPLARDDTPRAVLRLEGSPFPRSVEGNLPGSGMHPEPSNPKVVHRGFERRYQPPVQLVVLERDRGTDDRDTGVAGANGDCRV